MAKIETNSRTIAKKRYKPFPAERAFVSLLSTTDKLTAFFEKIFTPFDITGQQYNVLRILRGAEPDGLPTLTVAERMIERAPGITRMIDRLEMKGLVTRELRPHDRRYVYCQITGKGLSLLELLDEPLIEGKKAAFRGLNQTEIEQLIELLAKIREANQCEF